jgi:ubiquinone/menaquinone biosynthesis C-methylase UbiE
MERIEAEEMLDSDRWPAGDIACALTAIRRVNRLYGGDRMHKRLFRRVCARTKLRRLEVLEAASARGEVIQAVARALRRRGVTLRIALLDRSRSHLPAEGDRPAGVEPPQLIVGDACEIPLPDRSVDVVSSCLFLHHLSEQGARIFLQEALRVARVAVLINDVERTRTNYMLSKLQRLVDPSWLSRHDGPTSVRQAYTFAELRRMLAETGREFELRRGPIFRLGAILWQSNPASGCSTSRF